MAHACANTRRLFVIFKVCIIDLLFWLKGRVESSRKVWCVHLWAKNENSNIAPNLIFTKSCGVLFHPGDILIHPVLQKLLAAFTDVAGFVKQPLPCLDKCFGLPKCQYADGHENIAQMLLCHGRTGGAGRSTQHSSGLA